MPDAKIAERSVVYRYIKTTLEEAFQIVLSISLVAFGIRGFMTGFEYPLQFSRGFPVSFLVFYFSLAIIGGTSALIGVYLSYKSFWFSGLERFGLYVSAPAWGSYAIVNYVSPLSDTFLLEFFLFFGISLACLMHADAIDKRSQEIMGLLRASAPAQWGKDD